MNTAPEAPLVTDCSQQCLLCSAQAFRRCGLSLGSPFPPPTEALCLPDGFAPTRITYIWRGGGGWTKGGRFKTREIPIQSRKIKPWQGCYCVHTAHCTHMWQNLPGTALPPLGKQ